MRHALLHLPSAVEYDNIATKGNASTSYQAEGSSIHPATTPPSTLNRLKVLIVDDSGANRKMIKRILLSACETIRTARGGSGEWWMVEDPIVAEADDGVTAVAALKEEIQRDAEKSAERNGGAYVVRCGYDIVFLDYIMLSMNGPEATNIMRSQLGYKGQIIGVTGNALPEDLKRFVVRAHRTLHTAYFALHGVQFSLYTIKLYIRHYIFTLLVPCCRFLFDPHSFFFPSFFGSATLSPQCYINNTSILYTYRKNMKHYVNFALLSTSYV